MKRNSETNLSLEKNFPPNSSCNVNTLLPTQNNGSQVSNNKSPSISMLKSNNLNSNNNGNNQNCMQ